MPESITITCLSQEMLKILQGEAHLLPDAEKREQLKTTLANTPVCSDETAVGMAVQENTGDKTKKKEAGPEQIQHIRWGVPENAARRHQGHRIHENLRNQVERKENPGGNMTTKQTGPDIDPTKITVFGATGCAPCDEIKASVDAGTYQVLGVEGDKPDVDILDLTSERDYHLIDEDKVDMIASAVHGIDQCRITIDEESGAVTFDCRPEVQAELIQDDSPPEQPSIIGLPHSMDLYT